MFREEVRSYSAVVNVGRSVILGRDRRTLPILMLSSYYDLSGGPKHPITVVAGYISSVDAWADFDTNWKAFLSRPEYRVSHFRMSDFAHSRGPFIDGWKGQHRKRREFLEGLIRIIQRHAFRSFSTAIEADTWDAFVAKHPEQRVFKHPYAYCGWGVVAKAREWAKREGFALPIRSVFEEGDEGRGHLERLLKRFGHPKPIFLPKVPTKPAHSLELLTPLQAADFSAYEIFKIYKLYRDNPKQQEEWESSWGDTRESFKAIYKAPPAEMKIVSTEDIEETWRNLSLNDRLTFGA